GDQRSVGTALDAVERDLHAVDAVLGLDADLLDRLIPAPNQPADRRGWHADPARIPVGQALARRDVGPGGGDARSSNRPARMALRIDRLTWPASPGEHSAV